MTSSRLRVMTHFYLYDVVYLIHISFVFSMYVYPLQALFDCPLEHVMRILIRIHIQQKIKMFFVECEFTGLYRILQCSAKESCFYWFGRLFLFIRGGSLLYPTFMYSIEVHYNHPLPPNLLEECQKRPKLLRHIRKNTVHYPNS